MSREWIVDKAFSPILSIDNISKISRKPCWRKYVLSVTGDGCPVYMGFVKG